MAKPRDPFDVPVTDAQRQALAVWLCDEIDRGLQARASTELEVDYWHTLYEQARTRTARTAPWPDAADLTSYLSTANVDALHARVVRTVLGVDPIWTVEGWGAAAERAPIVEEFTQWKAEESRLQSVIDKWALCALIEPRGLLEVYEGSEWVTQRKTVRAKIQLDPLTGGPLYDDRAQPILEVGPDGRYVEAQEQDPMAEIVVDEPVKVRTGPVERVLPYRDSLILPAHARDREDIWGYGKRLWKRIRTLQADARRGTYDLASVERMTDTSDRETSPALARSGAAVAQADRSTAEKELWELLFKADLSGLLEDLGQAPIRGAKAGERWYLATVHPATQQLLRLQHDDLERSRFIPVILFPRPDRVTEGFSFVGHKLITTIEEHTAWRNMAADRAAMIVQAPIKRLEGALWDPLEQPWGPRSVIDVRTMDEIEPVQVPDFSGAVLQHIQMMEQTAERLSGINDVASGQVASESRTLGEVQMATEQSFVRMDLIVRRFQESLEDLAQIRHAIWLRTLRDQPEGMELPPSLLQQLEGRGVTIEAAMPSGKLTADALMGVFRFKPFGSVETANPSKRRQDLIQFIQGLPMLVQTFPALMPVLQQPLAARAMLREFLRAFRIENQQPFLAPLGADPLGGVPQSPLDLLQAMGGPQMPPIPPGPGMLPPGPPGMMPPGPPSEPGP